MVGFIAFEPGPTALHRRLIRFHEWAKALIRAFHMNLVWLGIIHLDWSF